MLDALSSMHSTVVQPAGCEPNGSGIFWRTLIIDPEGKVLVWVKKFGASPAAHSKLELM